MAQDFKKLIVWQEAINFDKILDVELDKFPKKELYAMCKQLRRASQSISSNIAEGCGRGTNKELRQYLRQAMGSCKEVESNLILAFEKGYINKPTFEKLNEEITKIGKRLNVFIQRVSEDIEK